MPTQPRPIGVTVITLLMALCLIAEFTLQVKGNLPILHGFPTATGLILYAISFAVLPRLVSATVLIFFWRGRDWALWMVLMSAAFHLARLGLYAKNPWFAPQPLAAIPIAEAVFALFLLVYLNTRSARAWFE